MRFGKMFLAGVVCLLSFSEMFAQNSFKILSYSISKQQPGFYNASYIDAGSFGLRSRKEVSFDNGKTWHTKAVGVKNLERIQKHSRREAVTSIFDKNEQAFITFFDALDDPAISKGLVEPKGALKGYYLRYRVSKDKGATWLYDKSVMDRSQKIDNPFPGIRSGENAFYLGDKGSKPILLDNGHILLPVQATILPDPKNKLLNKDNLYNPSGASSYFEVLILEGVWKQGSLSWTVKSRIKGDPQKTTRGLFEPTLVQLNNGKILVVMRGSNGMKSDPQYKLPSYKWYSYSEDNGNTWSEPQPWKYDNGQQFYSPSSMSLLVKHSSGRVFWIGNIAYSNPKGNFPRYPLVIGEVDQHNMLLKQGTVQVLDTFKKADKKKGSLDVGHVTAIEDRQTGDLIVVYPRIHSKSAREWATVRLKMK